MLNQRATLHSKIVRIVGILVILSFAPCLFGSSDRPAVHAVAYAHMDTQWRWTIQDTILNDIPGTLRENFKLLLLYPAYQFSFSGAWRYMLAKEYWPEDYVELRKRIEEGRWHLAGGFLDEVDANIPAPESLIRHSLYTNKFFKQEFGKESHDVLLPDSFGFSYALPSIAAHSGLVGFSSYKLSWGSAIPLPFDLGMWRGPDGTEIAAALNPGSFANRVDTDPSADSKWIDRVNKQGETSGVYLGLRYYGVGDKGGAPNEESVTNVQRAVDNPTGELKVVSASSDQLFLELTPEERVKLPRYQGELLMSTHGVGCYTSHAEMKWLNRRNEMLADSTERAAVTAEWLGGAEYPSQRLRENWIRFLWNQMHDVLPGTCLPRAYTFSQNDEFLAQNQFAAVLQDSVGVITRAMDTRGSGVAVAVYNPLGFEREDVAETQVELGKLAGKPRLAVEVTGPDGKKVPAQLAARTEGDQSSTSSVSFLAKVPPVGFAIFDINLVQLPEPPPASAVIEASKEEKKPQTPEPEQKKAGELTAGIDQLENTRFRVRIDADGNLSSIYDRVLEKELLSAPVRLEMRSNVVDLYPAWEIPFNTVNASPKESLRGPAAIELVEDGPARMTLEIRRRAGGSPVVQRISLSAGGAGNRVEIATHIDWKERATLLKMAFAFTAANPKATYDLGLGTIERGNNTPKLYEVPAQQWADLTDAGKRFGISVITDSKYGWDKPNDKTLRSTLIHTPFTKGSYRDQNYLDHGRHKMTHALYPHAGDWREAETASVAARVNQPLITFQVPQHAGHLGKQFSLAKVSSPHVAIRAIKKAEDGSGVVIRLQELSGSSIAKVRVTFAAKVLSASEANGVENVMRPAAVKAGELMTDMGAYQPRTFIVKLAPPSKALQVPPSTSIPLAFDARSTSEPGKKPENPFDQGGVSIPVHLWPENVQAGGVHFQLGPKDANNGMRAKGQILKLPAGKGKRRLHLLAAAAGGNDVTASFQAGDSSTNMTVHYLGTKIGQWDAMPVTVDGVVRGEMERGFVKQGEVGWTATHRYDADGLREVYLFCHLFKYGIEVPEGVNEVKLPEVPAIGIFAASITSSELAPVIAHPVAVEDLKFLTDKSMPVSASNN